MIRPLVILAVCSALASADLADNEIEESARHVDGEEGEEFAGNHTLAEIYEKAVQAYLEENWDACVDGFHDALDGYKAYRRTVTNCRRKCRTEAMGSSFMFPENIEDLHFYEKKVRETLCLLKCNKDYQQVASSKTFRRLPPDVERKFLELRVYEYLHICYYQRNQNQAAANAIFTFLLQHPDHEVSVQNLKFYLSLPDVLEEKTVNLEAPRFLTMYMKGVMAYEDKNYEQATYLLESSLKSYLEAEEECRVYCEGPFDQGWLPEFTSSISNHFAYCLKCKHGCSRGLSNVNGEYREDLLRSHYNYLQFAYYKLGNAKKACAAAETYLLFEPMDETMLDNKEFYSRLPKVNEDYFVPREEALSYVKRQEYEMSLLRYIVDEFALVEAKFARANKLKKAKKESAGEKDLAKKRFQANVLHTPPGHSPSLQIRVPGNLSTIDDASEGETSKKNRDKDRFDVMNDVQLVAGERELGGRYRYVANGFLNQTECASLIKLARIAAVEGDGYEANKSPHSSHERFEGVTVGRSALMVYYGMLAPELLELFLQRTEAARRHVERYFNLDRHLYFTYTHLVCRTALPGSPVNRTDLSHQIHADNCLLSDGGCVQESPAYTWRDYSAILYLNDDFEGGEFFFAKDRKSRKIESTVQPGCGRMVAFSAGGDNLHGVKGVLKGKRCALALWFTQDENYYEHERILAEVVLKRVRRIGHVDSEDLKVVPVRYENLLIERFEQDKVLRNLLKSST